MKTSFLAANARALLVPTTLSALTGLLFTGDALASCSGVENWECRFSALNTIYSGMTAVNNDIVAGTVIGNVTVNYQYSCSIPMSSGDRTIRFGMATENNVRSGADLLTNVDGLTYRVAGGVSIGSDPFLTTVGGVNNRVQIDAIRAASGDADTCIEGSNSVKVFDVIKDGQITDSTHIALDFPRSVNFMTARYSNAAVNTKTLRVVPSVATIDAAATTCTMSAPTNVVFPPIPTRLGNTKPSKDFKFSWTCSSIANTTTSFSAPGYAPLSGGVGIQDENTRVILKLKNTETGAYIPFGTEQAKQIPSGGTDITFTAELSQLERLNAGEFGFDVVYTTFYK
ncbi:hypothetical protein [Pseudomonas marincola]|uniref:hypothetical protein n=1 Tax=Pseudomonas marincola TaxID=437900 RepID=UPI0008E7A5EE|nr:hypothetical protein [Pseudomonas marincola]SFU20521.1 hypothetical protein SAMN05216264_1277 [Pseudomonas marincola]